MATPVLKAIGYACAAATGAAAGAVLRAARGRTYSVTTSQGTYQVTFVSAKEFNKRADVNFNNRLRSLQNRVEKKI